MIMLRVSGRKFIELTIPMCNSVEREIDHPTGFGGHICGGKALERGANERRRRANCAKSKRFFEIGKESQRLRL